MPHGAGEPKFCAVLGFEGVTLSFSGIAGAATTDANGNWSKTGITGKSTIVPHKEGWVFEPASIEVSSASDAVNFTAFPDEQEPREVVFEDQNLEDVVRDHIGKPVGPIFPEDLEGLTDLDATDAKIESLQGIESIASLQQLIVAHNYISDLTPLSGLTQLETAVLGYNYIDDLQPLASLKNLMHVDLTFNPVMDLGPLVNLPKLESIWIFHVPVDAFDDPTVQNLRAKGVEVGPMVFSTPAHLLVYSFAAALKLADAELMEKLFTSEVTFTKPDGSVLYLSSSELADWFLRDTMGERVVVSPTWLQRSWHGGQDEMAAGEALFTLGVSAGTFHLSADPAYLRFEKKSGDWKIVALDVSGKGEIL